MNPMEFDPGTGPLCPQCGEPVQRLDPSASVLVYELDPGVPESVGQAPDAWYAAPCGHVLPFADRQLTNDPSQTPPWRFQESRRYVFVEGPEA